MHTNSAHIMAMANSFWPFAYSFGKSYDLSLHPAFMSSAYRSLPVLPTPAYTSTNGQNSVSSQSKQCDKFSIDAILNKDKRPDSAGSSASDDTKKYPQSHTDSDKIHETSISRRHHRLLEASHPYLAHTTPYVDLRHQEQQQTTTANVSSAYRQLAESPRSGVCEKVEKKCNAAGNQSWSKSSKGKRVRTIFTPEQLERMEAEFERQQYMVGTERYYLATSLNLTEAQVKVWFQNRRIKWRKQHLEQQKAKLNSIDIYNQADTGSESESEDEQRNNEIISGHMVSMVDPFQSPKEMRSTQ